MPAVTMEWTPAAKAQFDAIRQRAIDNGQHEIFNQTHAAVVHALRDLSEASRKGEKLFETKLPGGEVRHWICDFISVCYALFPRERAGWILKYATVPASWPD